MNEPEPVTTLSAFSSLDAEPTAWAVGREALRAAEVYWLSTVRPDGRPHVTPLLGVWMGGALYFCTGADERKAKNLTHNPGCILTTGRNTLEDGVDIVVEGEATTVEADADLREVAAAYESKYGAHLTAPAGTWFGLGDTIRAGDVQVYRVPLSTAFGFGKGTRSSVRPDGASPNEEPPTGEAATRCPWDPCALPAGWMARVPSAFATPLLRHDLERLRSHLGPLAP